MKAMLNYRYLINLSSINFILLIAVFTFSVITIMEYQDFRYNSRAAANKFVDKTKYSNAITFLKDSIQTILSNSGPTKVNNQTFNLLEKTKSGKIAIEYTVDLEIKYLDLVRLIESLIKAQIINRITYLKMTKTSNGKLAITLKTENLVNENDEKKAS